jgi:outer membrane protein assembly factor BamB
VYHEDGERAYLYKMTANGVYPNGGSGMTCIDAESGQEVWTNAAPLDGSPAWWMAYANYGGISFHDGLVFMPTYNFNGITQFACIDAYTGARKWYADDWDEATGSVATDSVPIVIGDIVYLCGHYDWYTDRSALIGFNIHTGQKVFEKLILTTNNMWNVSPAATNDRIYVTEGSAVYAGNAFGLHIVDPVSGADLATSNSITRRVRGSVAIGSDQRPGPRDLLSRAARGHVDHSGSRRPDDGRLHRPATS